MRLPALGLHPHMATVTELTVLSTAAFPPYDQETLGLCVSLFLSNFCTFLGNGDLGKRGWLSPHATSEPWEVRAAQDPCVPDIPCSHFYSMAPPAGAHEKSLHLIRVLERKNRAPQLSALLTYYIAVFVAHMETISHM